MKYLLLFMYIILCGFACIAFPCILVTFGLIICGIYVFGKLNEKDDKDE